MTSHSDDTRNLIAIIKAWVQQHERYGGIVRPKGDPPMSVDTLIEVLNEKFTIKAK